ncbi:MAG: polysaccharide biosynthesis protein, partial [Eubacterium sp.]|nr:polysaccharide biosynthesis protein [Eubacterium sp.]
FGLLMLVKSRIMSTVTVLSFGVMFIIICVVFNGVFLLLFGRTEEFKYLWNIVAGKLRKRKL